MPQIFHHVSIHTGSPKLQIVLPAPGCEWARTKGPCLNCGFADIVQRSEMPPHEVIKGIESILNSYRYIQIIKDLELYCSGSLLNDNEISSELRTQIFELISKTTHFHRVLLESRPEYITDTKVESLKRILGNIDLEIGIGLETADDEIRRTSIHKCFDLVEFERAVKVLSDNQTSLLVYLLIKPAYLSERKAINDAINSGIYTFDLAKKLKLNTRIEYGPVFVQRDTPLYQLYAHRKYRTPWLWSVVEVIKNTGNLGPISIAPIESELMPKNTNMIAAYCTNRNNWNKRCSCSSDIEAAIRKYNKSRSLDDFIHTLPNCGCKREWLRELNY